MLSQWEQIKKAEREETQRPRSILEGVPTTLPALQRAYQTQKRASRVGFDWTEPAQVIDKLDEELKELRQATLESGRNKRQNGPDTRQPGPDVYNEIEQEFGDVLFTMANIARFLNINPEEALRQATNRFTARFQYMEKLAEAAERDLQDLSAEEWDRWWEEAKQREQAQTSTTPIPR